MTEHLEVIIWQETTTDPGGGAWPRTAIVRNRQTKRERMYRCPQPDMGWSREGVSRFAADVDDSGQLERWPSMVTVRATFHDGATEVQYYLPEDKLDG